MAITVGVNMEFIRCKDQPFDAGVAEAARIGYRWVEPMVHTGRELLSEAGYFHSFSMDDDPLVMKEVLDRYGVKASALSAHCPLMRPEISVPYLERAIRFAAAIGIPAVVTDEGIRPDWLDDAECFQVMKYTLTRVLQTAQRHGIYVGIEPHQSISKRTEGLLRIATLVKSEFLAVNYDTGNAFLGGEDPYAGLKAVRPLLIHVHAKDISIEQADEERGKVAGTPVGCACGEGVIDWAQVISILRKSGWEGVLSVECGTPQQATDSLKHLEGILATSPVSPAIA
ncbi:MAG TPA: sugar phosphate isomerase/epimerase family protein [Bryobacteraceae bacterium]|nr:sugar phosphate isomerase/epimerase family protein [Bryobacteraceae bacterium]